MRKKPEVKPEKQLEHPELERHEDVIQPPVRGEKPPDVIYPGPQSKKARKE